MSDEREEPDELELDEVIDLVRLAHPRHSYHYSSWSVEGIAGLARDANRLADEVTRLRIQLQAETEGAAANFAIHELRWQQRVEEAVARRESEVGALMDQVEELRRALDSARRPS